MDGHCTDVGRWTEMNADTTLLRMVVSGTPYGLKEELEILKEKAEAKEKARIERKRQAEDLEEFKEARKSRRQEKLNNKCENSKDVKTVDPDMRI